MKKAWLSFFSGEAWVANPLMLSPAMGCLLIFFIFPMIATVVVSFTDWELGGTNSVHFIGWDNYIGLWESDDRRIRRPFSSKIKARLQSGRNA